MQPRWYGGVFLGRRLESNEVNVSTEEGLVARARDAMAMMVRINVRTMRHYSCFS